MNFDFSQMIDLKRFLEGMVETLVLICVLLFMAFRRRVKEWLEKKINRQFETIISKSARVRDHLIELRALYDADRVLLFRLHNGQYYFGGEGADKVSMTDFYQGPGIASPEGMTTTKQNIPVTHWSQTFKFIADDGIQLLNVDDENVDPGLRQMMSLDGVSWMLVGAVKDRRGHWRGILFIGWFDKPRKVETDHAEAYLTKIGDLIGV